MAHQNEKHLTTEQLSALLDKQLSASEQLDWNAHLRACQECQARLADLRRTVALLHALPQAELPRSFVLPASTTLAPERPVHQVAAATITPIPLAQRKRRSILQRSVRAMSTLAAAIGFILILSGFLANLHIVGGEVTFAPSAAPNGASITTTHNTAIPSGAQQPDQHSGAYPTQGSEKPSASSPQATQTPPETVKAAPPTGPAPNQHPSLPAILDLSTFQGQEALGLLLLVLGIVGLIITRIIRRRAERI